MKYLRYLASAFVLLLLAGFVLAFSVYSSYTDLAEHHRIARANFADWEAALAPRRTLMGDLTEILSPYAPEAIKIAMEAEQVRSQAPGSDDIEVRLWTLALTGTKLSQMRGLAQQYPQVRESDDYRTWEAEYLKYALEEEATRTAYNSSARNYNEVLESMTGKLISLVFSVKPKPIIAPPAGR